MRISEFPRELAWHIKSRLVYAPRLRRKAAVGDTERVSAELSEQQQRRFEELGYRYALERWNTLCTLSEYRENLYLLDVLDSYLDPALRVRQGLDIGCRNFANLPALYSYRAIAWDGVEIDAHARYRNLYTRRSVGDYLAGQFGGCRYLPTSLTKLDGKYQLILWFLPFLFHDTQRAWGLPERFFEPQRLLRKAWTLLDRGGTLFIVNQGEHEAQEQSRLCAKLGIDAKPTGEIASVLSPFSRKRYGFLITKP